MGTGPRTGALQDVITSIRQRILERLNNPDDPRLEGIRSVVYGEQQRIGAMQAPSLWVVAEPYNPEPSGGVTIIHRVPYNIVALVKDSDPQRGIEQAEWFAHGAYDVLLDGRDLDGLVNIVTPGQVDPGFEAGKNQQLQFAAVQVLFEFRRKE